MPQFFPGYAPVTDGTAHRTLARQWNFPAGICEPREGCDINSLFEKLRVQNPEIRALYLIGENPVISEPNPAFVREGLSNLDFLVVQDIFFTETCQYADVVLPAACWAEKDGTQTNTERRVQRIRTAARPPGEAKPDWEIITAIAGKMGYADQFPFRNAREVFEEICSVIPQYRGMTWDRVGRPEGICWPCPTRDHPGTPILYRDGFSHPDGKGIFFPVDWKEPSELPDKKFPLRLTTGRIIWHWQSGTMTRRCKNLTDEVNEGYLEINPEDAESLRVKNSDLIRVVFRRGSITCKARIVRDIKKGTTFMPFHFIEHAAEKLGDAPDTLSRLSENKTAVIAVEKIRPGEP
jgi:formate dehydrogenase major subunit